ncbi:MULTISPECIES: aspartate:alanine exchanger family transporter [unclassified Schaalia]|uniref:aspartate:alanine exchanger family transporter n=1 Tax=unclassified Schaalia TaxID=2691889 RepID=UPI001E439C97|nr:MULTISPECIES: TrkA C-terminal domain-containing protein [unclassified Schaalia]MCD4548868.1 transporter [Schaalia sp. lx-260]MCD4557484.1 transporter [Schaalia sp. lx-100]
MSTLLSANHLLTLFLVVGAGAVLGAIRFGPIRLGAAGALFVGLALSAAYPGLGEGMTVVQQIGLAFFVYTVGVASGAHFFADLMKQRALLFACALTCILGAFVAWGLGEIFGLNKGIVTGLFTGALTAAPALDAASRVTGDPIAAVGYAFGYPIGVIVGIIVVSVVVGRVWDEKGDTPSLAGKALESLTVRVNQTMNMREVSAWAQQRIRMSYLRREGRTRVIVPGEELRKDDHVLVVGDTVALQEACEQIGEPIVDYHLVNDRSDVAFERIVVSNPEIAGRTVASLAMPQRFGGAITRVRRGDLDLLARDDLALQLGDHAAVVVPIEELDAVQTFLGDSERRVSEVDAMAFGIGMVLGMLLGAIPFPMPGGATFQLGSAAGPLIVGMILGALRRTGPLVWTLPVSANFTIRQVGLLLFLAALGLSAGPDLVSVLVSTEGWKATLLSMGVVTICCIVLVCVGRFIGLSPARTAGGVAGFLGQPAVLQAAASKIADERVEAAYATLFAFAIVVKIFLVPLIWTL